MASVPNMRLGPSVPPSGGGSPAEGDVGDLFAQLLLSTPILDGSTEVLPEAGVAVATERPEGEEILLALTQGMAFQPVAIPAAPAASVVAQSAIETPPATVSSGSAPTAPATAGLQPVPTDPALPNAEALRSEAP